MYRSESFSKNVNRLKPLGLKMAHSGPCAPWPEYAIHTPTLALLSVLVMYSSASVQI